MKRLFISKARICWRRIEADQQPYRLPRREASVFSVMTQSPTQWSVRVDEYIQVVVLRNEFDDLRDILEADGEVDPYAWRKFSDAGSLVYLQAGLQFERVMPLTSLVRESLVVSWITRPECERDYPWIV